MSAKPVLHNFYRSSASWRVRIALAYKGIDYEYKSVDLGQERTEEYKNLNPSGQVPTLVTDGLYLTQSIAIIEYLEDRYPEKNLLPKDLGERAQARRIAEIVNSGIQPHQNGSILNKIRDITGDESWKVKWANEAITNGFKSLEPVLATTSGKYCIGDQITIADVCLVPQLRNAHRFKVDMSQFPIISRVIAEAQIHPAFKAAEPVNQPDCPDEAKI